MKKSLLISAMALTFADVSVAIEKPLPTVETMVVTATRTAQTIDETLAPVSVITRRDIEVIQPTDFLDLISHLPGVDLSSNGGPGASASLYMRGTSSGQVLVLIDGMRIASATLGEARLQHLSPDQIERIEVVRGPRSSLYGSEAIGGVIQIFTRQGSGEPEVSFNVGMGSDQKETYSVSASGKEKNTRYSLNASHFSTDGIDNLVSDGGTNADADAYRESSITASIGHDFESGASVEGRYYLTKGHVESDDRFDGPTKAPFAEFKLENINLSFSLPVTESWKTSLLLGKFQDESLNYNDIDGLKSSELFTDRDSITWQNDFQFKDHLIVFGLEHYEDKVAGSSDFNIRERYNKAAFLEYQTDVANVVDVVAAVRREENEQFGYKTTYNAALGFDINEQHRLIISQATAFRAPTFNDLYWPDAFGSIGNDSLSPEESRNKEVEIRGDYESFSWSLNLYRNEIDNLIEWTEVSDPVCTIPVWATTCWTPNNVSNAVIKGSELTLSTVVNDWRLDVVGSYIDPKGNYYDSATGVASTQERQLTKRAKRSLAVNVNRDFGDFDFGLSWLTQSERFEYDSSNNKTRTAGYGVVDLKFGYQITPKLKAQLKVDNVFDQDYQLNSKYNTEGTKAFLSFNYSL